MVVGEGEDNNSGSSGGYGDVCEGVESMVTHGGRWAW